MALKKCKECGHQVSSEADACPSCGYSLKKEREHKAVTSGCGCLMLVVLICIFVSVFREEFKTGRSKKSPPRATPPKQTAPATKTQENIFYVRIAIHNDTERNPISENCRIWMKGYGDFYPAKDSGWKFGGALIEKAGPFDTTKTQTLYFYPDYSDESREIKVPLKFSKENNPDTSIRDMLDIAIEPKQIKFGGLLLKNAIGKSEITFDRRTCKTIE